MPESDASERGNVNHSASNSQLSANERVMATRRAFLELEGSGISDFEIFNALADLYYQRGEAEISQLMAEAAYKCFQRD
ncbi:MAG: hypothetical protein BRC51_10355 [Cyanobacteria bacterium SW_12_48_29]|jgi:hypothetical protein|nr:MAG: hypothetical protein BRC51_10355 [Cyanobacteria bacterium SW_12_48_29]